MLHAFLVIYSISIGIDVYHMLLMCNYHVGLICIRIYTSWRWRHCNEREIKMANNDFYLRYYVGHHGKFGHEFLEFEFRPDGNSATISTNLHISLVARVDRELAVSCLLSSWRTMHVSSFLSFVLLIKVNCVTPTTQTIKRTAWYGKRWAWAGLGWAKSTAEGPAW